MHAQPIRIKSASNIALIVDGLWMRPLSSDMLPNEAIVV